jgi:hypothetical protein
MRFFWIDRRLAWPTVSLAVYTTAWIIAVDYLWRVLVVPFDTLLLCAALVFGAGAVSIAVIAFVLRRSQGG